MSWYIVVACVYCGSCRGPDAADKAEDTSGLLSVDVAVVGVISLGRAAILLQLTTFSLGYVELETLRVAVVGVTLASPEVSSAICAVLLFFDGVCVNVAAAVILVSARGLLSNDTSVIVSTLWATGGDGGPGIRILQLRQVYDRLLSFSRSVISGVLSLSQV